MAVVPYKDNNKGKKEQVTNMFNKVSKRYDLLNHLLSLGVDIIWRKKAIKLLRKEQPNQILDVATGTGDFALEALSLKPERIVGIDISEGMLEVGRQKMKKKGVEDIIQLQLGDSEDLPFPDKQFDAVIAAFGVRNFENLEKGLAEMHRVLKPGGMLVIIELSKPRVFPFKQLFNFYFKTILPKIGKGISDDSSAYTYLPASVQEFPDGDRFLSILQNVGFKQTKCKLLSLGISSIYTGKK